ncbi:MAG TPA: serine/threonine-protein kinase [Kofleriaceae bacterium]|nr:serine/threonine-protein kinase [Kofleriaceae bacterium]
MAKQVETLDASVSTPDARGRETAGIARGDRIGKYLIGDRIGRGGMGVVYTARDERLGRDVAIKLAYASGIGSLGRAEREAQSLAKLSHPNVVTVYEVGEHAGRLFVAMEYVAGGTIRTWLVERTRSWREIVAMYSSAAAGLAAAHAAGIVHRDFKPDNVLVGSDGRPRVADFGLALAAGARTNVAEHAETPTLLPDGTEPTIASGDNARLTETGTVVGTPAYMAPEQLRGADADARVDQFALCVAMWEALYGVRPFQGSKDIKTWEDLAAAYSEPPKTTDAHVPRHIAAALRRGLSRDPAARWPSVDALLSALSRDRRRERMLIAGGVAVLALGATGVTLVQRGGDPCAKAAGEIDSVWSPQRAVAMHARFVGQGAGDAWPGVARALDHYADEWADAERATCKAARDHAQPPEALDTRGACVYRARSAFGAVTDALLHADRAGVATAADQVHLLPLVSDCGIGMFRPSMPSDPRARFRVIVLESAWLAVQAEIYAHVPQPKSELDALDTASAGLDHTRLRAMAATIRGRYELSSGDPTAGRADFDTAIQESLELGDDSNAAMLMTDMADSYIDAGQIFAAKHWTKLAEGIAHRLGDPPDLASVIAGLQARAIEHSPELHDAAALRRRQVELSRKAWHDPVDAVIDQENLAFAARDDDDPAGMQREVDKGIGLIEANLGIDHPMMIHFESFRTVTAMREGKLDDAERYARHAIALAERWYGGDSVDAVTALQNLGAILQRRGDIAGMMNATQRALAAAIKRDPDGEDVGHLEGNIGIAYASLGDLATAAPHLARATAIVEHLLGPDADPLNDLYVAQAYVERGLKHYDESRQLLVRAVAIADKTGVNRVNPRVELSYTLALMHRAPEAVVALDSVGALVETPATEPRHAAEFHLALADALWEAGNHARAIAEATKSRDAWGALGSDFTPNRDEAVAWLRKHS